MAGSQTSDISESSSAVNITASYSETTAEKMRISTIVFVTFAVLFVCAEHVSAMELCPKENCLISDKCEEQIKNVNVQCFEQGTTCCSVVKREYQTHCRHFGGECMNQCPTILTRQTVDCENEQVCCVLV